jgi:hypothetical protein
VFGSGAGGFGGDLDFTDDYPGTGLVSMEDTDDPDAKRLKVDVRLATFSVQVPYLSQVGTGETIQIAPPTPANPVGRTHTFTGSIICMPTTTKMCIDYWGITAADGGDLSRNALMQACWDEHTNPTVDFPCPRQADRVEAAHPCLYGVDNGPSVAGRAASIPSTYAQALTADLAAGKPVVTSTYATSGHVMCARGAVVTHDDQTAWLIFNDPYDNLAGADSSYDQLDVSAPVGLPGGHAGNPMNVPADVRAVREVLAALQCYDGPLDGPIDETEESDRTVVAIRAFQSGFLRTPDGRIDAGGNNERRLNRRLAQGTRASYSNAENEVSSAVGEGSDRGRHVYYNSRTEARGLGGTRCFRLKAEAWTLVIEPSTTPTQDHIRQRPVPGQ